MPALTEAKRLICNFLNDEDHIFWTPDTSSDRLLTEIASRLVDVDELRDKLDEAERTSSDADGEIDRLEDTVAKLEKEKVVMETQLTAIRKLLAPKG